VRRTSLGSLSEANYVFDAQLITPIIEGLAKEAIPLESDPKIKAIGRQLTQLPQFIDQISIKSRG
ncbi:MAG: hypothetical protein HY756_09770, partial [Nitrospirae bacterium]|nr:hypothetical protein [Nitrospirota bacterium]